MQIDKQNSEIPMGRQVEEDKRLDLLLHQVLVFYKECDSKKMSWKMLLEFTRVLRHFILRTLRIK